MFADVDSRLFAQEAPGTRDLHRAVKLRDFVNAEQERSWASLKKGGSDDARARDRGAIERARLEGFAYRPVEDLAAGVLSELITRLERLEEILPAGGASGRVRRQSRSRTGPPRLL